VFIRAPRLRRPGADVEVLARVDGWPVWIRRGRIMATTFHPELTEDPRVHQSLVDLCEADPETASGAAAPRELR
jgi:5'-phosphate synthase pdxT subunit